MKIKDYMYISVEEVLLNKWPLWYVGVESPAPPFPHWNCGEIPRKQFHNFIVLLSSGMGLDISYHL